MTQLQTFAHAERIQESGDNYGSINRGSGASGAYQFLFSTWQSAMRLAGLSNTIWYHLPAVAAPPAVQDAAAEALMWAYYNEFGHSWFNVAEAWYGGPGAVGHPGRGGGPGYPNVGQYAASVIAIFESLGGPAQPGGPPGGTPPPGGPDTATEWNQALQVWTWLDWIYTSELSGATQQIAGSGNIA